MRLVKPFGFPNDNEIIQLIMPHPQNRDYSTSVYEDTWEDMGVLFETWKALHGVDSKFCVNAFRQFADWLEQEEC